LELHLGNNRLLEVPGELGMLAQLRLLNLCDNQLTVSVDAPGAAGEKA
jgi:hypothetical protein